MFFLSLSIWERCFLQAKLNCACKKDFSVCNFNILNAGLSFLLNFNNFGLMRVQTYFVFRIKLRFFLIYIRCMQNNQNKESFSSLVSPGKLILWQIYLLLWTNSNFVWKNKRNIPGSQTNELQKNRPVCYC